MSKNTHGLQAFHFTSSVERPNGILERSLVVATDLETAKKMLSENYDISGLDVVETCDIGDHIIKAEVMTVSLAPKRPPMKSANDLYKMEAEFTSFDPYSFERIFEEDLSNIEEILNRRVSARRIISRGDGYRCYDLITLWLDDQPFGIHQEAGRGGHDHNDVIITDWKLWNEARKYLISLDKRYDYDFKEPDIDPDQPMRRLTSFYGGGDIFTEE